MKIQSISKSIENPAFTVVNVKNVQIKKVTSFKDMLELKNKFSSLQKAVRIGDKIFVDQPRIEIPLQSK